MLLLSLANFDPSVFEIYVVCAPRGRVYEKIMAMPHVKVIPTELGGIETTLPEKKGAIVRRLEICEINCEGCQLYSQREYTMYLYH